MSQARNILIAVAAAAGIGAILWYHYGRELLPEAAAPAAVDEPAAAPAPAPAAPAPEYRVPETSATEPDFVLPELAGSDSAVRGELEGLVGRQPLEAWLIPNQIVRRWVAFIDNLDRDGVPLPQRPARHVAGVPVVEQRDGQLVLAAANAQRYAALMTLVRSVDAERLVHFYFRYYPLFQRAYGELGYGQRYFNTRLIEVLDHLLATPSVEGPIVLTQPKVLYQYADPQLEALSFGQKAIIRLGADNATLVKAKLRQIRAAIVAGAPAADAAPR